MIFQLLFAISSSLFAQQHVGNVYTQAKLITDNNSALANVVHDISQSKRSIEMHYYIFNLDETGSIVANELVKKAKVGINVKLIVDQFINIKNIKHYKAMAKFAGPNLQIYLVSKKSEKFYFWHEIIHYCIVNNLNSQKIYKNELKLSRCGELNLENIKSSFNLIFSLFFNKSPSNKIYIVSNMYGNSSPDYNRAKKLFLNNWLNSLTSKSKKKSYFNLYNYIMKKILFWYIEEVKDLSAGMHSKYTNVDGETLYIGGRNIADEYLSNTRGKFFFSDIDVRLNTNGLKISNQFEKLKNDKKIELIKINSLTDFRVTDKCLSKLNFKEYIRCINVDIRNYDTNWVAKMKEVGSIKLPIGKFESIFQTYSQKNLINKIIEKKLSDSCSATLISPYMMPSYIIRKVIYHSLIKECDIQLITNAWGFTDFNLVNLFGKRSLLSLSKLKNDKLKSELITYWGGSNLHMKLIITNYSLIVMSSNLNLRMIDNEINNIVLLKFDKLLDVSQLIKTLKKEGSFTISNSSEQDVSLTILRDFSFECIHTECQTLQSLIDEILKFVTEIESKEYESRFSDNDSILDMYFDIL